MIQHILVPTPMRDGACLSADIRLPSGNGKFPVVLIRTPYNNSGWSPADTALIEAGYVVVKQDCRGRFDSDGIFAPLREDEDGHDSIKWVKAQPWCDGRIGMVGGSYNGLTQFTAAWTKPAGLRAITPAVMGHDLFKNVVYYNGVFNMPIAVGWAAAVAGRSGQGNETTDWNRVYQHLPLMTMDEAAGYHLDYVREWLAHPVYDDYWKQLSTEQHFAGIDVPCFHAGGWFDIYAEGTVTSFSGIRKQGGANARKAQYLIMGPWPHGIGGRAVGQLDFGDSAAVSMDIMYRRWLDRWVLDRPNGIDREPPVRIFVMGTNVWRDEHEWPLARTRDTEFFLDSRGAANSLHGNGVLRSDSPSGSGTDQYSYDPANPVPMMGGQVFGGPVGPCDHVPIERRDDVLVYSTEPLTAPLEVTGHIRMVLHASSDAVDTDFVARLCDVHPDGRSMVLCDGIVRTRFREGLDREVMMQPGKTYELAIPMSVTSNVFGAGHRIRLEITSSCFPRFARNLNTGEPAATGTRWQTAQQTVHHSRACPSRLILPLIPAKA